MSSSPKKARKNPSGRVGTSDFFQLLSDVKGAVDVRLSNVLSASVDDALRQGLEVAKMVEAVRSLSQRGGKRLRPGLCVIGALCVNPTPELEPLLTAGVALELLQTYFLIHDDWMDEDDTRRGGPTAHVALARAFRSPQLGERSAILAGDHAVALASRVLSRVPASAPRLVRAHDTFAGMQLAAVAGQQLDVVARTKNPELTYELKTSSYTVTGPLVLGAELCGAKAPVSATLRAYGRPTGVAFQLADDLIGVFGDPKKTGKPRGADLTAGKNTPLVHHGKRLLAPKDRELLDRVLKRRKATPAQLNRLVLRLDECGAKAAVLARIAELRSEGLAALETKSLSSEGRQLLVQASHALTERDA